MMLRKNYYLTLGIMPSESPAGVREAFREIIKRYHPDRIGSERLRFFQELVEAYRVLADPERRSRYDEELSKTASGAPQSPFTGDRIIETLPQPRTVFRMITLRDAPFEAALALVSGRLTAQDPPRDYCQPLDTRVILSPSEAAQGGVVLLSVPSCVPCGRCRGSGREGFFPCDACDGEGLNEEQEIVRVLVPAMVPDGTIVNLPLRGLGVHNFYLRVQVRVATPASSPP
jgi:DnaJ-class molecular chaperone